MCIRDRVKVRGFRIELGEIEAALLRHPLVTDAAVTIAGEGDDNQRLVCHYEARQPLASEEVAQFLARTLPSYMVPSGFLQLGALPKTVGGKVDRRKLPPVPIDAGDVEEPRDALESELRDLWSELLKVPCKQISVTRSFFQLGGCLLYTSRCV